MPITQGQLEEMVKAAVEKRIRAAVDEELNKRMKESPDFRDFIHKKNEGERNGN